MTTTDTSWVLITGASSGFGKEFARQYAEQGHSLVLVARRLDQLQALAETLRRQYRIEVMVEQVDLADVAEVIQLHRRLHEQGITIDILINNAGHGLQGPFVDNQLDVALSMVQLDVASLTAVTHVFAQDMRARGRGKVLLKRAHDISDRERLIMETWTGAFPQPLAAYGHKERFFHIWDFNNRRDAEKALDAWIDDIPQGQKEVWKNLLTPSVAEKNFGVDLSTFWEG